MTIYFTLSIFLIKFFEITIANAYIYIYYIIKLQSSYKNIKIQSQLKKLNVHYTQKNENLKQPKCKLQIYFHTCNAAQF